MATASDALEETLDTIRSQLSGSRVTLSTVRHYLKRCDWSGNGKLDNKELDEALRASGVFLSKPQLSQVMRAFDRSGDGSVDYDELLVGLKGELSPKRLALVEMAFGRLDRDGSGVLSVSDLTGVFNATAHPDVLEGTATEEDVLKTFLDGFEGIAGDKDGKVTWDEFQQYYEELSASFSTDAKFVAMMESCWMITLDPTPADVKAVAKFEDMLRTKIEERTHGSESGGACLQRIFKFFDTDFTGKLTLNEFGAALLRVGIPIERRQVGAIFDSYDADGSGAISITEFSRAVYASDSAKFTSTSIL